MELCGKPWMNTTDLPSARSEWGRVGLCWDVEELGRGCLAELGDSSLEK